MASATFKYVPQTATTTFAFSSVCFFFYGTDLSTRKMVEMVATHWVDITTEELAQGVRLLRPLLNNLHMMRHHHFPWGGRGWEFCYLVDFPLLN